MKSLKQNIAEKRKVRGPYKNFFKPCCSKKPKSSRENIAIDDSDVVSSDENITIDDSDVASSDENITIDDSDVVSSDENITIDD